MLHLIESVTKEPKVFASGKSQGKKYWGVKINGKWYNCMTQLQWKSNVEGTIEESKDSKYNGWFKVETGGNTSTGTALPNKGAGEKVTELLEKQVHLLSDIFRVLAEISTLIEVVKDMKTVSFTPPQPTEPINDAQEPPEDIGF